MANKPFEIQSSTLTIGGVDLQAGSNGVVIPGVTRAATFKVEEVDERDGSNPDIFGSDEGAVTVIDNAEYLYLVDDGDTPSADYVAATYSVDELDDGEIHEINVESDGVFAAADKTRVEAGNMWATTTPTPFVSFNTANWTQIPYRPKIQANTVELEGSSGLGGVIERSIQFPMGETGDTRGTIALTPDDATYICTADYENLTPQYQGNYSVVNSEAYDINQSGGESNMITVDATGNTDLLFIIANGSYANSDWTIDAGVAYGGVQTCDSVATNGNLIYFSWPHRTGVDPTTIAQDDPATVTYNGTITQQPIWTKLINISQSGFDNGGDGQISWSSEGDLTIETLRPQDYDGDCDLNLYAADDVFITANGDDVSITAFNVVNINTDDGNHTWTFDNNGTLTFPDNTVQTTAYIAPTTASPAAGTLPVGAATAITVTNSPNANWTNGTGAFANGINFTIAVDGSGNATVSTINDGGTGHFVGETFGPVPGTAFGGTSPADDMYFEVTAINTGSVTALDLTKQTQILTAAAGTGVYSLANGSEGQIMYFVPAGGVTSDVYIQIANARIMGEGPTDVTDYSWTPFTGELLAPTTIAMAIFADGAWCLRGGATD